MQRHPPSGEHVSLRLSPAHAKHIAGAIQIKLASECEGRWSDPLPAPADLSELRALLDLHVDQFEKLQWGEPPGDVELSCPRALLDGIACDLVEGGEVRLASCEWSSTTDVAHVRRQGQEMLAAAQAIRRALARHRGFAIAS
jgi:hypothetical protein